MANGTPPAVPGWIQAASQVVTTVGFPVVVAAALLWFLLTRFQTNMDSVTTRLEISSTNAQQFLIISKHQIEELERQTEQLELVNKHLTAIAEDVQQRRAQEGNK
jgi:hypothetical protein